MPYKRFSLWASFFEIVSTLVVGVSETLAMIMVLIIVVPTFYILRFFYDYPGVLIVFWGIFILNRLYTGGTKE